MTSIVLASGKGGVGKSTISLNLSIILASAGKKVTVVDADVAMANLGLLLGIERAPITLHNVLKGEHDIFDAVYEGPLNLRYVPSGLSLEVTETNEERMAEAIKKLEAQNDFVIIDCPPGLGIDAMAAMKSAKEMIIIITPEPSSLADALKVKSIAEKNGVKIRGIVLNMILGDRTEIKAEDLETVMGAPVLAKMPEDIEVRRAAALQVPVVIRTPNAPFSKSVRALAARLTGQPVEIEKEHKSFFDSIVSFFHNLFKPRSPPVQIPMQKK
ncbi:MAG: cell division ATPase MinD [Candidatus Micrarchaeota archaeon]